MSDPLKNSDIEDVLSSIRRLVSEEPNARVSPADDAGAKVERLVLTPAFRVSEDEATDTEDTDQGAANETNTPEPSGDTTAFDANDAEQSSDTYVEANNDVFDEQDDEVQDPQIPEEFEANGDWDDPKLMTPDESVAVETDMQDPVQEHNSERRSDEADWQDYEAVAEEQPAPEPQDTAETSLENRIAELEAALQNSTQDWEPDGSEDLLDDETTPISASMPDAEPDLSEILEDTAEEQHHHTTAHSETESPDLSAIIEASIEEALADESIATLVTEPELDSLDWVDSEETVEADHHELNEAPTMIEAEAKSEDQVAADDPEPVWEQASLYVEDAAEPEIAEPESAPDVDEAIYTPEPEHASEPEQASEEQHSAEAEPQDPMLAAAMPNDADEDDLTQNILRDDAATIDEDTLREMISELVRQELQGALGERITRNVRRLVRREIQRAMAMRDLE